ncbi:MAG TPA: polysaccharide biosynthesis C-terminal domain-containing protein [Candidatus Acidoferrales bacterium]|nr:polysaccharide biosynthesis C-terminal domain-containing protein [Candidatus Acidoferrales bacterium]
MKARKLFSDGFAVLSIRMLTVVAGAAVSVVVSRTLGPQGRGTYVIPGMVAALVATPFAGLSTTVASSMLRDCTGAGAIPAALFASLPLIVISALAALLITALMHQLWALPFTLSVLPFLAISAIATGYAYGTKNPRAVTTIALVTSVSILTFLSLGFVVLHRTSEVAITMWLAGNVFIGLASISVVLWHSRRLERRKVATWPFFTYSLRVAANGVVSLLNYRMSLYIVAFFLSHAALGLYSTAVSSAETIFIAAQVASIVTASHIGSLSPEEAAHLAARCIRNNLVLVALGSSAAMLAAPFIIRLLFGAAFLPAVPALRLLLLGMIPMSVAGVIANYYTLNARRPQVALIVTGLSAAACATISVILVPRIGITGAAIGTTASYAISIAFMIGYFSRQTKIAVAHIICPQREDIRGFRALFASLLVRPSVG